MGTTAVGPNRRAGGKRKGPLRAVARALVLEDDPLLAIMIEDALSEAGLAAVTVCADAASALTEFERERPDILILDVFLADRDDGWAMAELVAELSPTRPTIVFSTGAPERIPANVAELGTVLVKPYTPEDLIAAIQKTRGSGILGRLRGVLSGAAS